MSLFFALIALVFVYLLVRKLFSQKAAGWTMLLMVISPMLIRYSEEARMYTLVMAIVAAATYVLVSVMEKPSRKKWITYGVLVSLGMWTHYFTAIIWITHWVWRYTAVKNGGLKKSFRAFFSKEWIWVHVLAVGLYLPWLPFMIEQVGGIQGGGFWISPVTVATPFNFLTNLLLYRGNDAATSWLAFLVLAVAISAVVLFVKVYRSLKGDDLKYYSLLLVMAFVPMVILFVASMPPLRPAFVDRYILSAIPFWSALFGVTIALGLTFKNSRLNSKILAGILIVTMTIGTSYVYQIVDVDSGSGDALPVRATIQEVGRLASDGEPIVNSYFWRFYESYLYDTPRNPLYFEPSDLNWGSYDMLRESDYRKVDDLAAFAKQHGGRIWYTGDWDKGQPVLPKGNWKVIQEVDVPILPDDKKGFRAFEIELQ